MISLGDSVFYRLSRKLRTSPKLFTLVDIEDFDRVCAHKWRCKNGVTKYAVGTLGPLSNFILNVPAGQIVDHISGDGLDNRKQNLRICTQAENNLNRRRVTFPGKTSRFKGVCWSKYDNAWLASISRGYVTHSLGLFADEADAARAYDKAALDLHGEFARTNAVMRLFEFSQPFVPDNCRAPGQTGGRRKKHLERALIKTNIPWWLVNKPSWKAKDIYYRAMKEHGLEPEVIPYRHGVLDRQARLAAEAAAKNT